MSTTTQAAKATTTREQHVMLDLETMGTRPDAAIVAIGAVAFTADGLGKEFYCPISLSSSVLNGGTVDADTICWWMAQSNEARKLFTEKGATLPQALALFGNWLLDVAEGSQEARAQIQVWGTGADFDNVILTSAYKNAGGGALPWGRFKNRCYRTMSKTLGAGTPRPSKGTAHNALDDARNQAAHMLEIVSALEKLTRFAEAMKQMSETLSGAEPVAATEGGAQ